MKCIKSIRATKDVELGEIRRVDDKTAFNMVGSMWAYVSKSEWKLSNRKSGPSRDQVGTKLEPSRNQVGTKLEPSSELVEKKPYKKGERSEKHKNKQ